MTSYVFYFAPTMMIEKYVRNSIKKYEHELSALFWDGSKIPVSLAHASPKFLGACLVEDFLKKNSKRPAHIQLVHVFLRHANDFIVEKMAKLLPRSRFMIYVLSESRFKHAALNKILGDKVKCKEFAEKEERGQIELWKFVSQRDVRELDFGRGLSETVRRCYDIHYIQSL